MKNLCTLLFLFLSISLTAQDCDSYGEAQIDLAVNNINARLLNSGDFWWDGEYTHYFHSTNFNEAPYTKVLGAGALWIGGKDQNDNIKLAAQKLRAFNNSDYYPGPLDSQGEAYLNGCSDWDKFFVINKDDVLHHKADFSDGEINIYRSNVYGWPARNNPHFETEHGFEIPHDLSLAPFFDQNEDGDYNPDHGDYPLMKGDQSIWWVFNDNAGPHRVSLTNPLQIEVNCMAYAYTDAMNESLSNTTFYDFKVNNKADELLKSGFFGFWVLSGLGCSIDDYVGYDQEYEMMYSYNREHVEGTNLCFADTFGSNVPMVGIKKMPSPESPITSFIAYKRDEDLIPKTGKEFYNMLSGYWPNGRPLTIGGNGYNEFSSDTTSFLFTGDPAIENEWSMCSSNLESGYNRSLISTAMGTLLPGESFNTSYAVVFVENTPHPCPSLDKLKTAVDQACGGITSSVVGGTNSDVNISLTPNPAHDQVLIQSTVPFENLSLTSINGQLIYQESLSKTLSNALDVSSLPRGMYILEISNQKGLISSEKLIIAK